MTSAAWQDRPGAKTPGVRPVAALSGKRLAPLIYDLIKERLLEGGYQAWRSDRRKPTEPAPG